MKTNRLTAILGLALAASLGPLPAAPVRAADPAEVSKDIIAVQIRKQGFACKTALSAERDPAASSPDEAAWILKCDGARYKVKLIPKMAAEVERLPDETQP